MRTQFKLDTESSCESTNALMLLADVNTSEEGYKSNRLSSIIKTKNYVQKVINVLTDEYINPFANSLDKESLYSLSSGLPVESDIATGILRIKEMGEEQYHTFIDSRIKTTEVKIHEPITCNKLLLFKNACKKVEVIKTNNHLLAEINRNILEKLLSYSAKSGRAINFQTALKYPLSSVPLAFANPDRTQRATKKSQLMEIMLSYVNDLLDYSDVRIPKEQIAVVDLMALIRVLPGVCDTYEELAQKVFDALPVGYQRSDIVA